MYFIKYILENQPAQENGDGSGEKIITDAKTNILRCMIFGEITFPPTSSTKYFPIFTTHMVLKLTKDLMIFVPDLLPILGHIAQHYYAKLCSYCY